MLMHSVHLQNRLDFSHDLLNFLLLAPLWLSGMGRIGGFGKESESESKCVNYHKSTTKHHMKPDQWVKSKRDEISYMQSDHMSLQFECFFQNRYKYIWWILMNFFFGNSKPDCAYWISPHCEKNESSDRCHIRGAHLKVIWSLSAELFVERFLE